MFASSDNAGFEMLIAETRAAEQAGVFRTSAVDIEALAEKPAASRLIRFYEWAMVGLPVAACILIAVGIAAMLGQPGAMTTSHPMAVVQATPSAGSSYEPCNFDLLAQCVAGPNHAIAPGCGAADLDSDGDVDLVDMSSFQRLAGK